MQYSIKSFVDAARDAAREADANKAVRVMLKDAMSAPKDLIDTVHKQTEDEILLFEDDTVSIWSCRFSPAVVVPPHNHKMNAHIGVLRGQEKNLMFRRLPDELQQAGSKTVGPGNILSIGPDAIHAVTAEGNEQSLALHVYLGPLTQIERSLFDWQSGKPVDFTMQNFENMTKSAAEFLDKCTTAV